MTKTEFGKLVKRDSWCLHCGATEALAPNHRANRGHGGSKSAERPSNLVLLCSMFNGLIESDAKAARLAKQYGWKISRYDTPSQIPVYDAIAGLWWALDDNWTKGKVV